MRPPTLLASLFAFIYLTTIQAQVTLAENNVIAFVDDGQLIVLGDEAGNYLTFRNNRLGEPFLQGNRGTTINGEPRFRLSGNDIRGVQLDMGGGDDIVIFRNVSMASDDFVSPVLTFNGGAGRDRMVARGVAGESFFGGSVHFEGGTGKDFVDISDYTAAGDLSLSTNEADDRIKLIDNEVLGALIIDTGEGQGFVTIDGLSASAVDLAGGSGIDRFSLSNLNVDLDFGNLSGIVLTRIDSGASRDLVSLNHFSSALGIEINLGDGRDDGTVSDIMAETITVSCGAGTDTLIADGLVTTASPVDEVPIESLLDGGDSFDSLTIDVESALTVPSVNFENQTLTTP